MSFDRRPLSFQWRLTISYYGKGVGFVLIYIYNIIHAAFKAYYNVPVQMKTAKQSIAI